MQYIVRPISTDVACSVVCVSLLGTRVRCEKTAKPIEIPFWGMTQVGPSSHVLDEVQGTFEGIMCRPL